MFPEKQEIQIHVKSPNFIMLATHSNFPNYFSVQTEHMCRMTQSAAQESRNLGGEHQNRQEASREMAKIRAP